MELITLINGEMDNINHTFIQWNAQGLNTSKQDLLYLINKHKPKIIAIQETFRGSDHTINFPGYNSMSKQGNHNRRFYGGVSLHIHNTLPYNEININSEHQVTAARVQIGNRLITFASLYIPGGERIQLGGLNNIASSLPKPLIIMGDMNCHSVNWGNRNTTSRGRIMESFLAHQQINCLNHGVKLLICPDP